LVCGGFTFVERCSSLLLPALPPVLHVRAAEQPGLGWLRLAQELIGRELTEGRPGSSALASRLADAMLIEAVRGYFVEAQGEPTGWVAALRDPGIGAALTLIHREPERTWTVDTLAACAASSRSSFALRFSVLLGESPIRYVARCRMGKAARLLRGTGASIADVAEQVGYDSEAAFSRAFRRYVGVTPAAFRRAGAPRDREPAE
jgi:transcriptional regulator GlxA family with amidase domain